MALHRLNGAEDLEFEHQAAAAGDGGEGAAVGVGQVVEHPLIGVSHLEGELGHARYHIGGAGKEFNPADGGTAAR